MDSQDCNNLQNNNREAPIVEGTIGSETEHRFNQLVPYLFSNFFCFTIFFLLDGCQFCDVQFHNAQASFVCQLGYTIYL